MDGGCRAEDAAVGFQARTTAEVELASLDVGDAQLAQEVAGSGSAGSCDAAAVREVLRQEPEDEEDHVRAHAIRVAEARHRRSSLRRLSGRRGPCASFGGVALSVFQKRSRWPRRSAEDARRRPLKVFAV